MANDIARLPAHLRTALNSELAPGERLLYAGRPDWRAEWLVLAGLAMFGLFWSGISFTFFASSLAGLLGFASIQSDGAPAGTGLLTFALLFSLPFVLIGCVFLAAPFLAIRKSRATVHAVTDARLLNVFTGKDRGAESVPLDRINFLVRRDRAGGSGNLEIGYGVEKDSEGDPRPLTKTWSGIPDARRAEAAIRTHAKWVR